MCEGTSAPATPSNVPDFNVNFHLENLNLSCRNVSVSTEVWWGNISTSHPKQCLWLHPFASGLCHRHMGRNAPGWIMPSYFPFIIQDVMEAYISCTMIVIKCQSVPMYQGIHSILYTRLRFYIQDSDFEVFIFQLYARMPSLNPSQKLCS